MMSTYNKAGVVLGPGAIVARSTEPLPRGSLHSGGGIRVMLAVIQRQVAVRAGKGKTRQSGG